MEILSPELHQHHGRGYGVFLHGPSAMCSSSDFLKRTFSYHSSNSNLEKVDNISNPPSLSQGVLVRVSAFISDVVWCFAILD